MSKTDIFKIDALKHLLQADANLELAILVGSRALDAATQDTVTQDTATQDTATQDTATQHSDWDIAIRWQKGLDDLTILELTEALRHKIAQAINNHADQIDLIDMTTARLAMRAVIAEEGVMLKGDDTLAWSHFLTQTWAELEDYYWRKHHAA